MEPTISAEFAEIVVYIWERPEWPRFTWDRDRTTARLAAVRHDQGRLLGRMEGIGFRLKGEALLHTLTQDVVKSSEIEGERLDADQVRSSIARRLGISQQVVQKRLYGTQRGGRIIGGALPRLRGALAPLFPSIGAAAPPEVRS